MLQKAKNFPLHRLFACEAHDKEGEAVACDEVFVLFSVPLVNVVGRLKIKPTKICWTFEVADSFEHVFVFFFEYSCYVSAAHYGAVVADEDSERRRRDS